MADKTTTDGKVMIGICLDPDVLAKLDEFAGSLDRSRSWLINDILKDKLGIVTMPKTTGAK